MSNATVVTHDLEVSSQSCEVNNVQTMLMHSCLISQRDVRQSRLVTVGDRSFGSVGPKIWNSLPDDITSASSLSVFRKKLKTH